MISENLCQGGYAANSKGDEIVDAPQKKFARRICQVIDDNNIMSCGFCSFVVIKLKQASKTSIEYKSMKSFLDSVRFNNGLPVEDLLCIWAATMIDKGVAVSSRKRYFAKLGTIYKEYAAGNGIDSAPFATARELCEIQSIESHDNIRELYVRLVKSFDSLLKDAESHPSLAVFLYSLFNASSDIEKAIALKTDDYVPRFAQLDNVIAPAAFHHRRRYVFSLSQSQKRMPQLVKEVCYDIEHYFRGKGVKLDRGFAGPVITALWIAKARETGLKLSDIRATASSIPDGYDYLSLVRPSDLTPDQVESIKTRVANAFSPAANGWYAMKLRRRVEFESVRAAIMRELPECYRKTEFFYPAREVVKREGKRIVRERIHYIHDIVFFNIRPHYVKDIDRTIRRNGLGWVFRVMNTPDSDYSVIDRNSMFSFQRTVSQFTRDMRIEISDRASMEIGRRVRITGGLMAGYEGIIYDIKDNGSTTMRMFCIRLSSSQYVRLQVNIEEIYIEPVKEPANALTESLA